MTYKSDVGGRVDFIPSNDGRDAGEAFYSHAFVQERMVEALRCWWRAPDRERSWHHVKANWPEIRRSGLFKIEGGEIDWPEEKPMPRQLPLSRAEVAAMMEAADWMWHVPERDRRLVAMALTYLASGWAQPQWRRIKQRLGIPFGQDGLRMRYSRALTAICKALNARRPDVLDGVNGANGESNK
jgi:hypothetical protein